MKVVLDTNVLISAIFWKGSPNLIFRLAEKGLIILITSQEILEELTGVLNRPKFAPYLRRTNHTLQTIIKEISLLAKVVLPTEPVSGISADPADDKFLSCAVSSGAAFLISGDRHLLALKKFRSITITTPAQFLKFFRKT